jgi:hypothetical protein
LISSTGLPKSAASEAIRSMYCLYSVSVPSARALPSRSHVGLDHQHQRGIVVGLAWAKAVCSQRRVAPVRLATSRLCAGDMVGVLPDGRAVVRAAGHVGRGEQHVLLLEPDVLHEGAVGGVGRVVLGGLAVHGHGLAQGLARRGEDGAHQAQVGHRSPPA